ncbi:tetratricopeptide repeat protein [Streptomyces sp. NA02950]|uniref:tetratricopeptide repeat protein n=1 Tax=Streptomyces sp. NA02950 TaxID=2742137 RepID=UPI0015922EFF|nr:tetratricopeptide repeat protein [Streptomyces sp. NA02950]QKV95794.1 tetratricopeptide repeat protein [Streptomyces sp. NA02950]
MALRPLPPHTPRTAAVVCALAVGLTAASVVIDGPGGSGGGPSATRAARPAAAQLAQVSADGLTDRISALQQHLRAEPKDATGWAQLGSAYVEQARGTGDPTRYPQAQKAFARSLTVQPRDNDAALAGRASLAAARHDFRGALRDADKALKVNAYSQAAMAVRVDALVELGRYQDAKKAAEHADATRPGIPVFTRLAYVLELRGDPAKARTVLLRAKDSASSPSDIAYVSTALGQLAWGQGRYDTARKAYDTALRAVPGYLPALEGRGRTEAADGRLDAGIRDLKKVVQRYPLPAELAALGEAYEARGDRTQGRRQYAVVDTWITLAKANGVATDLDSALVAADHGDPEEALKAARAEWERRQTVHTADALAWALHRTGDDKKALGYTERAAEPGYRNAAFLYHRGMIEKSLGEKADARRHLRAALDLNPGFSPTASRTAKAALKRLDGDG